MSQTINMVVAALGGEGGGVFTNWVIDVAERENWLCQTTSLAGVAQRTGATIYYLELFPREQAQSEPPVMSLFPAQGDIDIAIASEIAEAGRMVQRGFVTKDRTTLIASDHRVYGITEKIDVADGRIDAGVVNDIAGRYAKNYVRYDMLALANQHGAVISAVMLGALAGAGVLPFTKENFIAVIEASGKAVNTNLAAFEASYQRAQSGPIEPFQPELAEVWCLPRASTAEGEKLLPRIAEFPERAQQVIFFGVERLMDYQDAAYAHEYLDQLENLVGDAQLIETTARWLALWMGFEDIPRVAQLKIRASRLQGVREEVRAEPEQLLDVTEFFKPRVEEMCALLPRRLGNWALNSSLCCKFLNVFASGKQLRTNTVSVFLALRFLAALRRFRRGMLGYHHEHAMIAQWLTAIHTSSEKDIALAREIAACGRLVKGYGETRSRTTGQLEDILTRLKSTDSSPEEVSGWRQLALSSAA